MQNSLPPWQAHTAPDYDRIMSAKCVSLLVDIVMDPNRRRSILADPRVLHRELFAEFVPSGCDEYAGTYRGAPGTLVEDRPAASASQLDPSTCYAFCTSSEVPGRMDALVPAIQELLQSEELVTDQLKLFALAHVFCWFGKIHPFLDGNGHVQRAVFAAMATEFGFPLSARFAIHPRPYDRLLALALELFSRAQEGNEHIEIPPVAEYLAFFLAGPFDAPGKSF